jgi:hypothetical protein
MSTKKILIIWIALFLTVPWWFHGLSNKWLNLPDWGLYAMIAAIIYSILLAFMIQKYWKTEEDE